MADSDEQVRLLLDAEYSSVQQAQVVIAATTQEVYDFSDSYEVLEQEEKRVVIATGQVVAANKELSATVVALTEEEKQLTRAMEAQARASQIAGKATSAFGVNTSKMNMVLGQAAYAVGDFASTSGDLGSKLMSISNNVQFAAQQFGPWGQAVGVAVTLTASLIKNWDTLDRAFREKVAIPEAADNVERMNDQLDRTEKRIKELNKLEELTVSEGKEYNKLLQDRHALEEKITAEKQKQKDLKKLEGLQSKAESEEEKERSKVLTEAVGGHQGNMASQLAEAMRRASERRIGVLAKRAAKAKGSEKKNIEREMAQLTPYAESHAANEDAANTMLANALLHGKKEDFDTIRGYMAESPRVFEQRFHQAFYSASPGQLQTKSQKEAAKKAKAEADKKAKADAAAAKKAQAAEDKEFADSQRILEHQFNEENRLHAADQRKKDAAARADRALTHQRVGQQLKEEDEFAERSGINHQAALHMAMLENRGFEGDELYERTHAAVAGHLARNFGRSREDAADQAHRITSRAMKGNGDKFEHAYSQAIANNMNVNQAMIYANQQLLQTLADANRRFAGQAGQLRAQGRQAASLRVRGRSFAPVGGGEG